MTNHSDYSKQQAGDAKRFQRKILQWYDAHGRDLPWRTKGEGAANPYHVWLSEVMLQQTTVTAVKPYFAKFTAQWPRVQDLAAAPQEDVMQAWAGLGYYARARNLHKAAQSISYEHDGAFPQTQARLIKLPGIGEYTSAAIAAIAFGEPATVIDGNIERIFSRYLAFEGELPAAKKSLKAQVDPYFQTCKSRAGDLAQALMDIGSAICTPKNPRCDLCPVSDLCSAQAFGQAEAFPRKTPKKPKDIRRGYVYLVCDPDGALLFERRPEKGLLAQTIGLPTGDWVNALQKPPPLESRFIAGAQGAQNLGLQVKHIFTHFELTLDLLSIQLTAQDARQLCADNRYFWSQTPDQQALGMPSLFQRVYKCYQNAV